MKRLRIFTWNVHGSYLYYLSHIPHDIYLPVRANSSNGYCGRNPGYQWGDNVHEIPLEALQRTELDCILFQSPRHYFEDQHEILSDEQRRLPKVYLEHDPPRQSPTDTRHWIDDPTVLLIHVTPFNQLMWDCGRTPVRVIDHGIAAPPGVRWNGHLERGATVINNIASRGRRLGADLFVTAQRFVPLDLAGMGFEAVGGIGELTHGDSFRFTADRRFFFHPVRYTSLGLGVLEAMMVGAPIIGFATTELPTVINSGVNGYVSNRIEDLVGHMRRLISSPQEAAELGRRARLTATERFSIRRFVHDWNIALAEVTDTRLIQPRPIQLEQTE